MAGVKAYDGSTFSIYETKTWDGSQWNIHDIKVWQDGSWTTVVEAGSGGPY